MSTLLAKEQPSGSCAVTLKLGETLALLRRHEWAWKEGNKVFCYTCGKEHRESTVRLLHRPGCEYDELIRALDHKR